MNKEGDDSREFCDVCHIGSMRPQRAIYARWHDGQFVVVPGVPALRCDFCGDILFDENALTQLVLLLGPESGVSDQYQRRASGLDENQETGLRDRRSVS